MVKAGTLGLEGRTRGGLGSTVTAVAENSFHEAPESDAFSVLKEMLVYCDSARVF